ncbi:MAG: DotI/IcmL family type IV secretion protein [Gammaproteobacteria bacterium]|nr:DotI/IcmL family type IV secretion protein [Gammaproteobacteria bacterium]MCH9762892.1 DotI/IcmL family type IV secretion protein [Gammaproteobacteria bacterium]
MIASTKKHFLMLMLLTCSPIICFSDTAPATPAAETTPAVINCQYKLTKNAATVEQPLLSTWAENAAIQSFKFNPKSLQTELDALKTCYTKQGWTAFNEALKTSGNLEAIEKNQLVVTSKISGKSTIQNIKDKQWKVSIPLKVTYQNKEKQVLQALNVELLISLNKSGALGIMQIIAVPKQAKAKKA